MASKVQIANFALAGELGKDQITALTDNTKAAKLVNLMFDDVAQEVMAEGAWTSATTRQTLARDATAPDWGFLYRYPLPKNPKFLGMVKMNELQPGDIPFAIENDYLLTDETTANIKYKMWQTDTEKWDKHMQRCVVLLLASKLAYSLTGNLKLQDALYQKYQIALRSGLAVDGTNSTDDDLTITDDLTIVRLGNSA